MVLRYLGLDFFCSSHALPAVISRCAFVSEGYACVIAAVCNPVKQIFRSRANSVVLRRELRARMLDSSGAEFWSVTLLWRAYSSRK